MASLPCDKRHRLRTGAEFRNVFQQRNKPRKHGIFTIRRGNNALGYARLGCAIPLRHAGNAVRRNLIRRVVKESFRLCRHRLGSNDYVVTCHAPLDDHDSRALAQMLFSAWDGIAKTIAAIARERA